MNSRLRKIAPVLTLAVLSAVIVELLFGSTHLTIISSLLPEIGFYGGAALIIRYVVRRQHHGWISILLLGLAFAVFEEFLIVQTSASPFLFAGLKDSQIYGRFLGVNWIYFLWAIGYESVWGIVLPIYLTEIIFPEQREDKWLGRIGLFTVATVFILASMISWYVWTQIVVPPAIGFTYAPPLSLIVLSLVIIGGLVTAATLVPPPTLQRTNRVAPRLWLVGVLAFTFSLSWFGLLAFAFDLIPTAPPVISLLVGLILGGGVLFLIRRLSSSTGWNHNHRLALIIGGIVASMLAGFWASGIVLEIDFIGKIVFNVVAVVLLAQLAKKLLNRAELKIHV
jgi:hypothetical protein